MHVYSVKSAQCKKFSCQAFRLTSIQPDVIKCCYSFIVQPQVSISPSITVVEGQNTVLQCNITAANPPTNVTWIYSTSEVVPSTNGSVIWPSVHRSRHGLYTCRASNGIGSPGVKTMFLTVHCKFSWLFTIFLYVHSLFEIGG